MDARRAIHQRIDGGLHDGMGFTFRNPERSTDPDRAVPGARSVIVAARSYLTDQDPEPAATGPQARVGRYAWVDHYAPLRTGLRAVAKSIRRADERAVAFADDNSMVDRAIAHRAGLGWFGKNANLLLPGVGSWFVLGSIVTTAAYEPTAAPVADGCGTCTRCIYGCPTGAIIAPGMIDAGRCLSWILQKPGTIPLEWREADRRPHLRMRRLPGRLPDLGPARPTRDRRDRRSVRCVGRCARPARRRRRMDHPAVRPLVRRGSGLPLGAPQRVDRHRQRR